MFPPGAHSPQGTPAVQTTHFQFHSHQINLVLTCRKGLNTGLTPGQMSLASKQPGIGPQSQRHGPGESNQPKIAFIHSEQFVRECEFNEHQQMDPAGHHCQMLQCPSCPMQTCIHSLLPSCLSWRSPFITECLKSSVAVQRMKGQDKMLRENPTYRDKTM